MDLFRSLSDKELDDAIKALALQIASGAQTISSPDAGSAGYITRGEAIKTLKLLERSRLLRLGLPAPAVDRITVQHVVARLGYHVR